MSYGGRRRAPRRAADRTKLLRDMAALVFALCGGLAVVYIFFAALGAIDIGEAVTASAFALGLGRRRGCVGFGVRIRQPRPSARSVPDRERSGF